MLRAIGLNNKEFISYDYNHLNPILSNKNNLICPHCKQKVIFVNATKKIKHFRHHLKSECDFEPETQRHIEMKLFMKNKLPHLKLEYNLKFAVPDLYDKIDNVAIEVQHSKISKEKFLERCYNYSKRGIFVLWIFDDCLLKENCPEFIREAHEIYMGRIYVYKNEKIFPVHFERLHKFIENEWNGNSYYKTYKLKRDYKFGLEVNYYLFMKTANSWKNISICKFDDKKFW